MATDLSSKDTRSRPITHLKRAVGVITAGCTALVLQAGPATSQPPAHHAKPSATAAATGMSVQLARWPAVLRADGDVVVTAWTTCPVGLTAFEFDVSVVQGASYGSTVNLERDVVPCDGVRHRHKVVVEPALGSFAAGDATINAYLSGNDGQHGDTEAYDETGVAIREAGHGPVAWIARVSRPVAADGSVWIRVWARCDSDQQAFELDIDVVQGDVYGPVDAARAAGSGALRWCASPHSRPRDASRRCCLHARTRGGRPLPEASSTTRKATTT